MKNLATSKIPKFPKNPRIPIFFIGNENENSETPIMRYTIDSNTSATVDVSCWTKLKDFLFKLSKEYLDMVKPQKSIETIPEYSRLLLDYFCD